MTFPERLIKLAPELGAAVEGVEPAALDTDHKRVLRQLLLEHKVLAFEGGLWGPDQLLLLAQAFGKLPDTLWAHETHRSSQQVEVVAADASKIGKANTWHADSTWKKCPPAGAVLQCEIAPPLGGDTIWVSMSTVFSSLSTRMRGYLLGLTAVHTLGQSNGFQERFLNAQEHTQYIDILRANPPVEHPVVIRHPMTDASTLFVNPTYCHRILGVPRSESDAVLNHLYAQLSKPEHQLRIRWKPGQVVVWDNYATQHYAASDYAPLPRRMNRVAFDWEASIPISPAPAIATACPSA
jgi:taurine dioxygenase